MLFLTALIFAAPSTPPVVNKTIITGGWENKAAFVILPHEILAAAQLENNNRFVEVWLKSNNTPIYLCFNNSAEAQAFLKQLAETIPYQ